MADEAELAEALKALGMTEDDVYRAVEDETNSGLDAKADEVRAAWIAKAPQDTGFYDSQVEISIIHDEHGRPARRVGDYAKYAHVIEYGSVDTPEFFVRGKVAAEFHNEGRYMVS